VLPKKDSQTQDSDTKNETEPRNGLLPAGTGIAHGADLLAN